jgi:glutamine synthetase
MSPYSAKALRTLVLSAFFIMTGGKTMSRISELFGSAVFNDDVMRDRLPSNIYKSLRRTMYKGTVLEPEVADVVANAMKDWAIQKGATHFTHWFQPMTGITAEKHDSFITPTADGKVIMDFSGKELVKGEPDASSFPSGGLRATFEARGYTAWDPTSPAFIKDDTLCIPTAFCSYSGEVLDKKTPLLRSMEALNIQAVRILHLLGKANIHRVITTVGPEQEYFLVDHDLYLKRKDLKFCGRTLLGAKPPKGQEMEDHYFGSLRPRVAAFMRELDEELWKLGVLAKTKHNEVAPGQHELAPIFSTTNIATDHNQLTMEMMKKVALRHNLACLLHEKPFAGVNGSGKHNNWSMTTDMGGNLLEPGDSPQDNVQFLLFLAAIIKAVDEYQDLLRVSVASAANDHRLGANEAPPAIVSIFLGDELTAVVDSIASGDIYVSKDKVHMDSGVRTLARFPKDTTDRNRTSPFAFTGNKFEFRMLGSAFSISGPNIILNTIVAEALRQFADTLESSEDFNTSLMELIRSTIIKHRRIIFNGNNYSEEWVIEAERRGLSNYKSTVDALPHFIDEKNIELFTRHEIFTKTEIHSRYEILMENYCKTIAIEAQTLLEMTRQEVIPAVCAYQKELVTTATLKQGFSSDMDCSLEHKLLSSISSLASCLFKNAEALDVILSQAKSHQDILEQALAYRNDVIPAMHEIRIVADQLETLTGKSYWPFPTYGELLFSV